MKYILRLLLLSSIIYSQDHFNLNINETGESSLFIFQDNISTLDNGDEIGIFDDGVCVGVGVVDNTNLTGNSPLSITASSQDPSSPQGINGSLPSDLCQ